MLLHQPLLPLTNVPARNALTMVAASRTPVACPSVLNTAIRALVMPKKSTRATMNPYRLSHLGAVSPRVKPSTRGAWFTAASGQMLRQSPGATKKSTGSSGTTTWKKANKAPAGLMNRPITSTMYTSTLITRMVCQAEFGRRLGSSV